MSVEPSSQAEGGSEAPRNEDATPAPSDNKLTDAELQAKYRKEYLLQLRRLSCPGCGEDFTEF